MNTVDFEFIERTIRGLRAYPLHRRTEEYDRALFEDMVRHIMEVLNKWTGQTGLDAERIKKQKRCFKSFSRHFLT